MPHSVSTFICRNDFPKGFTFGAASSAFQIEGAANEDGRGPSIWDTYCKNKGYKVENAIDHYHRYKEDVAMMKWVGLDAYRFSISWSRILPTGRKSGGLNFNGVKFYKELIDELLKNGIKPHITLLHWDVPQTLEDEYGGFRNSQIVDDFGDYADICFMIFGKEVKNWTTMNKPWSFSEGGYASGNLAPGRGDISEDPGSPKAGNSEGDPAREPYMVTHNQLLAHAKAVEVYRTKYQKIQKGQIGIALNSFWFEPASNSEADKKAKERALDFTLNWFLDPITVGQYPNGVKKIMKERNIDHQFSQKGSGMVKGSIDFLGIDYCTATYVRNKPDLDKENDANYTADYNVEYPDRPSLGENWSGAVDNVYPQGLKDLLIYVKSKYKGPIYITENGFGEKNDDSLPRHESLHDNMRISYLHKHLSQIVEVTKENATDKVNVKGYFAWTLWDNFEWASSFDVRYGVIHVDFKNDLKRTAKFSAHWLKHILQKPARKKKRQSGLIRNRSEPSTTSTRSITTSSTSTRSLQPSATNRAVGMRTSNFASNDFNTMSASSLGSNNFGTTYGTNLSPRDLESASEYEEDEDYESDNDSDPAHGSIDEENQESDNDSDPAHGSMDEEDQESDNDSDPAQGSMDEEDQESDNDSDPARGSMDEEDEDSEVNSAPTRPVAPRKTR